MCKKAVLVMDKPETCQRCMFCNSIVHGVDPFCKLSVDPEDDSYFRVIDCREGYDEAVPKWCPLKELPEEERGDDDLDSFDRGWTAGFNSCLQRIKGEK